VTKVCKHCEAEKDTAEFYSFFDKWSGKNYLSARCKPCHQEYKNTNPNTPKNRKAEKLQLRYGLSYEQWEKLREAEGYACMICGVTEDEMGKRLDVDHCHVSGKFRGVLCNPCNNILGHARDNPLILDAAAKYMRDNADGYNGPLL
jgi:hypothetical protein